jgi:hypothetical protein
MNNVPYLLVKPGEFDKAEPLFVECFNKRNIIKGDDYLLLNYILLQSRR